MPVTTQDPRSRVVVFRLTEREYVLLKNACSRARRSLSDFARAEVLATIDEADAAESSRESRPIGEQLSGLQTSLDDLKELVLCIISEIRGSPEQSSGTAPGRDPGQSR